MNDEQFQNEKLYQATMAIARNLLNQEAITLEEYEQIDTIFKEKYGPSLGSILADISLITLENRGVM